MEKVTVTQTVDVMVPVVSDNPRFTVGHNDKGFTCEWPDGTWCQLADLAIAGADKVMQATHEAMVAKVRTIKGVK